MNKVADGTIDCPCHGSKFNLDGIGGQWPGDEAAWSPEAITVQGDSIVLG